jgi:hypothetical protein
MGKPEGCFDPIKKKRTPGIKRGPYKRKGGINGGINELLTLSDAQQEEKVPEKNTTPFIKPVKVKPVKVKPVKVKKPQSERKPKKQKVEKIYETEEIIARDPADMFLDMLSHGELIYALFLVCSELVTPPATSSNGRDPIESYAAASTLVREITMRERSPDV